VGVQIPLHRQARSIVDVAAPMQWAPDSPGAKSVGPAALRRTQLRQGQIVDALHPIVRQHPDWFRWPEGDVTSEDIERLEKLQGLEREGDQAVR
jgi:hypothetical protein